MFHSQIGEAPDYSPDQEDKYSLTGTNVFHKTFRKH